MNLRKKAKPFKALGNERRLQIILILMKGQPLNVSDLAYKLQVTFKGVSKHLQVLENAGLVVRQRTGPYVYYRANVGSNDIKGLLNHLKKIK